MSAPTQDQQQRAESPTPKDIVEKVWSDSQEDTDEVANFCRNCYKDGTKALAVFREIRAKTKHIIGGRHPSEDNLAKVLKLVTTLLPVAVTGQHPELREKMSTWLSGRRQIRRSAKGLELAMYCEEKSSSVRHIYPRDVGVDFNLQDDIGVQGLYGRRMLLERAKSAGSIPAMP